MWRCSARCSWFLTAWESSPCSALASTILAVAACLPASRSSSSAASCPMQMSQAKIHQRFDCWPEDCSKALQVRSPVVQDQKQQDLQLLVASARPGPSYLQISAGSLHLCSVAPLLVAWHQVLPKAGRRAAAILHQHHHGRYQVRFAAPQIAWRSEGPRISQKGFHRHPPEGHPRCSKDLDGARSAP